MYEYASKNEKARFKVEEKCRVWYRDENDGQARQIVRMMRIKLERERKRIEEGVDLFLLRQHLDINIGR